MSVVFPSLEALLLNRRILRRGDGSFVEDGYDYGVWWRDRSRGVFRLTWIGPLGRDDGSAEPGELYLVRLRGDGGRGAAELLCVIPPSVVEPCDGRVEAVLDGWADVCGAEGSVEWVRARVGEAIAAGTASKPIPVTVGNAREPSDG